MVTNIDSNMGRLLKAVDERGLAESTIVVFLTDNGPAFARYNAGLRGLKGTTYEGGIRVPCFIRWPGQFPAGREVDQIAAHIDITPTVLDACQVPAGTEPKLDGRSLLPLLRGAVGRLARADALFSVAPRRRAGIWPSLRRPGNSDSSCFVPRSRPTKPSPPLELYDLEQDPFEQVNIAASSRRSWPGCIMITWTGSATSAATRGFGPIRIQIGDPRENPTLLTRQDWHLLDERAPGLGGYWELEVARPGRYEISAAGGLTATVGCAHLRVQRQAFEQVVASGADGVVFRDVALTAGPARLHAWLDRGEAEPPGARRAR